jgi:RNA polymerase sigma-70 factor (ECF subfamily)
VHADDAVSQLVREEGTRVLATLIRVIGDVGLAEDAAQDAVVRALETWPRDGVPDNPRGWLIVAAKRRAIDVIRRESQRQRKEAEAMSLYDPRDWPETPESIRDDLLRLVFTCCHPALSLDTQVTLALRTLGGLTTAEVARGLMVPEATIAKRMTRAKQKIANAGIPYRVPPPEELPGRLAGVAATIYLIFNEGYAAGPGEELVRSSLIAESVRLSRLLVELMPDEPTALGLLALLLLQDSRREARQDDAGRVVLLPDHDRALWDAAAIREGVSLVGEALRRTQDQPNPYVIQAAIAACHALASSYAETNWDSVISWYDVLLTVQDSPVVRLNRAVAERDGPEAGLALVDTLTALESYPYWHATRAELLNRLRRTDDARSAYQRALDLGMSAPAAEQIGRRVADLAE